MYSSNLLLLPTIILVAATTTQACSQFGSTQITFYGFPDNDPPGPATAFNCGGRNNIAGGSGTFLDPVTFASAPGEFNQCEIIYVPYLEKYARMEDICAQCETDFNSGKRHIDMWTGSPSVNGGQDQINCEDALTPDATQTIIRDPAANYGVDSSDLYVAGANPSCRNAQNTFPGNDAGQFCASAEGTARGQKILGGSARGMDKVCRDFVA